MADGRTIRQWFVDAMIALIVDPEGFSGKRPLGDSSWWSELRTALEDGDIVEHDAEFATVNAVLMGAVSEGFGLVPNDPHIETGWEGWAGRFLRRQLRRYSFNPRPYGRDRNRTTSRSRRPSIPTRMGGTPLGGWLVESLPFNPRPYGRDRRLRPLWNRPSFNPRPYGRDRGRRSHRDQGGLQSPPVWAGPTSGNRRLNAVFNPRPYGRDPNCFSRFGASLRPKMERDYQVTI